MATIGQFLNSSLIIIYTMDNKVINIFVKLKVFKLQFFTSLSNLNVVNNTGYTVIAVLLW